ncbi:helix-turn-helix transcriptional regulator [Clostridium sp. BL-8]|uniref:helix-turn-helix domain-containing protein n=1 Tax=Clostridium sp. BL-8 TaxID=349938 RepID=UPI00098CBF23|nr:helix-turn-helix transcriptional regulator [Clostridium sp. BL-8]OOM69512.1 HTH-type transcriptional repressor RghR [Clostridium sp. BL-8]
MENIGELLKKLREDKKLTLKELADKSGVGQSTISDIETGKAKNPRIDTLISLAKALDTTVNIFLDIPNNSDISKLEKYKEKNQIFFSRFDKLSNNAKDKMIKMLEIFEDETE